MDRSFRLVSQQDSGVFETQMVSVSRISGDKLSDEDTERYLSPVLVEGHKNHAVLFRTHEGTLLAGLPGRPVVKCEPEAGTQL